MYRLAREGSRELWKIYKGFDWQTKKVVGDQAITAIDSIGANIAEGFGRFHYLDKNKFYYNARGSLVETLHWVDVLGERGILPTEQAHRLRGALTDLAVKLNNYIASTRSQRSKSD